jgi:hypothetical protein
MIGQIDVEAHPDELPSFGCKAREMPDELGGAQPRIAAAKLPDIDACSTDGLPIRRFFVP